MYSVRWTKRLKRVEFGNRSWKKIFTYLTKVWLSLVQTGVAVSEVLARR